jgi:hypothetical protein
MLTTRRLRAFSLCREFRRIEVFRHFAALSKSLVSPGFKPGRKRPAIEQKRPKARPKAPEW